LDDCKVAVRSLKADFLSGTERREYIELMRVARYFMSGSDIACFTFVTKWCFLKLKSKSATWPFRPVLKFAKYDTLNYKTSIKYYYRVSYLANLRTSLR